MIYYSEDIATRSSIVLHANILVFVTKLVHHFRPGWNIMFICGMVVRFTDTLKQGWGLDHLQQIWQPLSYMHVQ